MSRRYNQGVIANCPGDAAPALHVIISALNAGTKTNRIHRAFSFIRTGSDQPEFLFWLPGLDYIAIPSKFAATAAAAATHEISVR